MVITVVPVPVTFEPVTSMVSMVESSDVFLITILPLSTSTASLNFSTILAVSETPVAPSAGDDNVEDRVGAAFVRVPLPVVVVPATYIQRLLVSHVPEELIVKSPSISIAFVDCVAEPLSITSWKTHT